MKKLQKSYSLTNKKTFNGTKKMVSRRVFGIILILLAILIFGMAMMAKKKKPTPAPAPLPVLPPHNSAKNEPSNNAGNNAGNKSNNAGNNGNNAGNNSNNAGNNSNNAGNNNARNNGGNNGMMEEPIGSELLIVRNYFNPECTFSLSFQEEWSKIVSHFAPLSEVKTVSINCRGSPDEQSICKAAVIDKKLGVQSVPSVTIALPGQQETTLKLGVESGEILIERIHKLLNAVKQRPALAAPGATPVPTQVFLPPKNAAANDALQAAATHSLQNQMNHQFEQVPYPLQRV